MSDTHTKSPARVEWISAEAPGTLNTLRGCRRVLLRLGSELYARTTRREAERLIHVIGNRLFWRTLGSMFILSAEANA